jgi:hypothetical protein
MEISDKDQLKYSLPCLRSELSLDRVTVVSSVANQTLGFRHLALQVCLGWRGVATGHGSRFAR